MREGREKEKKFAIVSVKHVGYNGGIYDIERKLLASVLSNYRESSGRSAVVNCYNSRAFRWYVHERLVPAGSGCLTFQDRSWSVDREHELRTRGLRLEY